MQVGLAHALAKIISSRSKQSNFQLIAITHDEVRCGLARRTLLFARVFLGFRMRVPWSFQLHPTCPVLSGFFPSVLIIAATAVSSPYTPPPQLCYCEQFGRRQIKCTFASGAFTQCKPNTAVPSLEPSRLFIFGPCIILSSTFFCLFYSTGLLFATKPRTRVVRSVPLLYPLRDI